MSLFEFFRGFFNLRREDFSNQRFEEEAFHRNGFRNPIWQNDEDDDDDEVSDFSDPFEMTRFFETQMDDMLRNFFHGFDSFGNSGNIFIPFGNTGDIKKALPFIQPKSNLREEFLKPHYEVPKSHEPKQDTDLDGRIKSDELAKIWSNPTTSNVLKPVEPKTSTITTFGKSVSTKIVRRPDGSFEEHQSIRDSNGNEEIKITRTIGDKIHTVITKRAKDGTEVKTEDLVNINESEIDDFNNKWSKLPLFPEDKADDFPWHKFFGPNPKL